MSAASRYHAWSTAAALASAAAMSVASESSAMAVITIPAIAMSWAMFHRTARTPMPRWVINSLLIALTLNLFRQILSVSVDHRAEDSIMRLSQYLIGLMVIKMFEHRRARDQAQALALGAMATIGAVLTSVTLGVAVWTGVYVLAALNSVVLLQFAAGDAASRGAEMLWDGADRRPAREDHEWTVPLRWLMAGAALAMTMCATAVFLIIPRDLGQQMIGAWQARTGAAVTGFSDEVQLGIDGVVSESDSIVMEVGLEVGGQTMLLPVSQYLRGAVLDQYDPARGKWSRSSKDINQIAAGVAVPETLTPEEQARMKADLERRQIVQRVLLRNKTTDHLFALWKPVSTRMLTGTGDIPINPRDGTIRLGKATGPVRYEVVSAPGASEPATNIARRDTAFTEGPLREYSQNILKHAGLERDPDAATAPGDGKRVEVLRQHLSKNCQYSLTLEAPPPGKDPIEWFIFESKSGSCEYFASALAAMCRSVGIGARVITGFVTNELDESSGMYIVRQRYAHAWVEALVPVPSDAGSEPAGPALVQWKTFDAVQTESSPPTGPAAKVAAAVKRTIERLESLWLSAVVSFNSDRQSDLLGQKLGPNGWIGSLVSRILSVRGSLPARVVGTLAVFVGGFALTSGALFLIRWAVRTRTGRTGPRARGPRDLTPAAREAHRMLRRLDGVVRRGGLARPSWVGPVDHARAIAGADTVAGELMHRVVCACYAARFGGASADAMRRERATIDEIGKRLRRGRRARRRAR